MLHDITHDIYLLHMHIYTHFRNMRNLRISQSKLVYIVETGSFSLKVMVLASSPRPALTVRHLVFST